MFDNTPVKPKFKGPFYRFEVTIDTDQEKGLKEVFLVFSKGKREAMRNYLWFKFVHDELSKTEFELFLLSLRESDEKQWAFLRALTTMSKKTLRKRLIMIENLIGDPPTDNKRYQGYKSFRIETYRVKRKLPKAPKYSGYIRSLASKGKGGPRSSSLIEAIITTPYESEEKIDWYYLLTVEHLPFFRGVVKVS